MLELLAPAGNLDAVIAAVQNGADAVYMGFGDGFNARRSADNFTRESFAKAVRYCHIRGCKVYVTLNTLVGDREMDAAAALAQQASDAGADAILVQDLGLARVLRAALPDIPLHASTQMSIHNLAGVEAAAEMGITRAVLARELSLEQIRFISQHASIETEVFVHGALCFCYSGQCYMSALIGRRSGNRGACAQPCRMQYSMGGRMDEYPLSLRDNCLADYLQQLEDAGVACVKIEGRMKRPEYVAVVTDVYARCIHEHRVPTQEENDRLALAFSRQGFTQGYLLGEKGPDMLGTRVPTKIPFHNRLCHQSRGLHVSSRHSQRARRLSYFLRDGTQLLCLFGQHAEVQTARCHCLRRTRDAKQQAKHNQQTHPLLYHKYINNHINPHCSCNHPIL